MKFKFKRKYEKISLLIDGPYNDPQEDVGYNENEFDNEYDKTRQGLESIIHNHCDLIGVSKSFINIGQRTGPSRGIALVVDERAKANITSLIESIQSYLKSLAKDYCVPINLVLDEAGDFKDLYIGITRSDVVFIHSEKAKWFKELGIS